MEKQLCAAEQELLRLYTGKAYACYQAGNLKETAEYARKMLALCPGDANAVFLKGAVCGRGARPGAGMRKIQMAFQIWMPLLRELSGEPGKMFRDAISEAFSAMTYTAVEAAARGWDVCQSRSTAEELSGTLAYLVELDDDFRQAKGEPEQWIHSLFVGNYVFWIDTVIGVNKPIPVGKSPAVQAYRKVLEELVRMGERMTLANHSEEVVRERVLERYQRFIQATVHSPAGREQ